MSALFADPFKVVLDTARDDVDVNAALGDLVQRRCHLGEEAEGNEPGPDGDQEADAAGDRCESRGGGPGLGKWSILGEQAVGEPGRDEQRVVATFLGGLHDLPQIVEVRRTLGAHSPRPAAVAVDRNEPTETYSILTVVHDRPRY